MDAPRIWVPKFKIHEAELRAPVGAVAGYYMLEACNRYGQVKRRLGPWRQLITDAAMDRLFPAINDDTPSTAIHRFCGVGTGSPSFTHSSTGLASPEGRTSDRTVTNSVDTTGADDYREEHTVTHSFAQGAIVANISEVGNFRQNDNVSGQFLDLVRDSGGSPTTFPVTADDVLRVTHILHRYPFLGSIDSSFTVGGDAGSGAHDYESNMAGLANGTARGEGFFSVFGYNNNVDQDWDLMVFRDCSALGANTDGQPTDGVSLGVTDIEGNGAASNDGTTWTRTKTFTLGLDEFNHANGINGFMFSNNTGRCCYKFFLDTPIPKFAGGVQRTLDLEFSCHITRGDGSS